MLYVQQGLCGWRNITASHTCADLHCGIEIIMSKYNYLANLINFVWGSEMTLGSTNYTMINMTEYIQWYLKTVKYVECSGI